MTELVDSIIHKMRDEKRKSITSFQIETIKKFDTKLHIKGLKVRTRDIQCKMMFQFARETGKNFDQVNSKDVEKFLGGLKKGEGKASSLEIWKSLLKRFYKITYGNCPKCVSWIEFSKEKIPNSLKSSDMLSEGEVSRLINSCKFLRDKALISLLYDCALRCGEPINCNVGDFISRGDRYYISVNGKTGVRELALISSTPLMLQYIDSHPFKRDGNQPLFLSYNHADHLKRLTQAGVAVIVAQAKERANLDKEKEKIFKRVYPHLFRHTKLTDLARKGMNESAMRQFAGWSKSSNMPEVYIHLSQEDVNDTRWELETGKIPEEKKVKSILMPLICPRCGKQNDSQQKYCFKCWLPLQEESARYDMKILNTFRSQYVRKILNIDVDEVVNQFWNFRIYVNTMVKFRNAFNGTNKIRLSTLNERLGWTKQRINELLECLIESGVVKVKDGWVEIQSYMNDGHEETVFDNLIKMQEYFINS